jgi:hypothetical integral membrane protein (TIGR02206 family)
MTAPGFWVHHFRAFTWTHLCVVVAFGIFIAAIVGLRRHDNVADVPVRRRLIDRAFGWVALAMACGVQIATLWPSRFDYRTSLPLHICDIGMFVSPLALILRWRPLRVISYFWGLGLSSLSFIYPDLRFGPADFQFWVFWAGHAATVGPALYDVTGRNFRPTWKDWKLAALVSTIYLGIMFPLDARYHLNYGYLGPTLKGQTSPFDRLGPWPWRVVMMYAMAMGVMLVLLILPRLFWRAVVSKNGNGGPITPEASNRSPMPAVADS